MVFVLVWVVFVFVVVIVQLIGGFWFGLFRVLLSVRLYKSIGFYTLFSIV